MTTDRRLPVKQLAILSICRFAEPIALTSVLPYLPEMMESFGVAENDIARWAGIASAIFSLSQALTGLFWGSASDKFGRKPIILVGLFNTMVTMLLWGFSTSLPMALTARALQGLGNGNVGILRTTVAEMCPWKELQPRAFSIMPLVYTIGAVFGPTLGGALANPLEIDPRKPRGSKFLEKFPYILPNILAAVLFTIGIVTGWLFLKETLESRKHHQDLGLRIGNRITAWSRKTFNMPSGKKRLQPEHEPLLGQQKAANDEEAAPEESVKHAEEEPSPILREVLSVQTTLNLVVYTLLALYTLAYDQLLPVFMHHPPQPVDDPNVSLPLKFAGGFGIGHRRIGIIFTAFAVCSTLCQFLLFPPIARYLGVARCLRIAFIIFPCIFFFTPFISLLPTQASKQGTMVALLMIRGVAGTFAFPTSTIMLTNSAPSLRVLGTINGVATSVSAVGRATGPVVGGGLFTVGVKHGYVILPFWVLSAIAIVASIPTWWLVEGKGFGDDPDPETESVTSAAASVTEEVEGGSPILIQADTDGVQSESEYGEPTEIANVLSYTSTRTSQAIQSDDEADFSEEETLQRRRTDRSSSIGRVRSRSQGRRLARRRSSVPFGMGAGFRRLSSNLGSTGIGGGGASWGGT